METRTILVLLGLLVTPFATADEAWMWTDDDGVVHYSDVPRPGAKRIELAEPNSGQSPAPRTNTANADTAAENEADESTGYTTLEFSSPRAEETLWNIEGVLNVSLSLNPPLRPGHRVKVYFDGNEQLVSGTSFQLQEVWRGVHNLQAEVVDGTGQPMIRSRPIRFYVQQNTVF